MPNESKPTTESSKERHGMTLPDSLPDELKILERIQEHCLQRMRSNAPISVKRELVKDFQKIQQLKKTYLEAWGKQTGEVLKKSSEELSRQAAKFGLKWPK